MWYLNWKDRTKEAIGVTFHWDSPGVNVCMSWLCVIICGIIMINLILDSQHIYYIWISNETHFILPNPENIWVESSSPRSEDVSGMEINIRPLVCGSNIGGIKATLVNSKCGTSAHKPKILNKIGGFFKFRVGNRLKIENIQMDSIDSQLQFGQTCRNSKTQCCQLQGSQVSGTGCDQSNPQPWSIPGGVSMFSFRTSSTSTTPGQLTLSNVDMTHILYALHSIIQINNNIGLIQFEHSSITHFGTCASVISNVNQIFEYKNKSGQISGVIKELKEGVSVIGKESSILQKRSVRGRFRDFTQLNPNNQINVCNPCTLINLLNLTVDSYFSGLLQIDRFSKGPYTSVGFLLNLHEYRGYTLIKDSTIKNSQIKIKSCSMLGQNIKYFPFNSVFVEVNSDPTLSFISISTNHAIVEIISNSFSKNSGFFGALIKIDNKQNFGLIIKGNKFTQNSGGVNTQIINILESNKCGGTVVELNEFTQNIRCRKNSDLSNDIHQSILMMKCNDSNIALKNTDSSTLFSPQGVRYTMNKAQVSSNIYTENFYTYMNLFKLYGYIHISNETYTENVGGIFLEAAQMYSPFKTTMQDMSHFKSWGDGQEQTDNRMIDLFQNHIVVCDGVTINDPADLSPRVQYSNMVLINVFTTSTSTVTFKDVKINRVHGGNETTIRKYTNEVIDTRSYVNYYKVGGFKVKKGVNWDGLIEIYLADGYGTLLWDGLEIQDLQGMINITKQQKLIKLSGSECANNFTMKNVLIKNLYQAQGDTCIFYFTQKQQSSHFYFHNFTVEQFGANEEERLESTLFYLQSNDNEYNPSIEFHGFYLNKIYTNQCGIMFVNPKSNAKVQAHRVVFNGGTVTNITSYIGLFYFKAGYNGVQLEFNGMDVKYIKSLYYKGGGFALVRNNLQTDASIKITNSKFYHITFNIPQKGFAYMINGYDIQNPIKMEFNDVTVNCGGPKIENSQAEESDFGTNLPDKSLIQTVFYMHKSSNKFRNMHILNCNNLEFGAIYVKNDPNIFNVKIENCIGIQTAGLRINIGTSSQATIEQFHTIGLKGKLGPSYYIVSGGVIIRNSTFKNGFGRLAGVVSTIQNANSQWYDVEVSNCEGLQDAVVQLAQISENKTKFTRVKFINNTAKQGAIVGVNSAIINFYDCEFIDNVANELSAGIYSIQSKVYLHNTNFSSSVPSLQSYGYIYTLLQSTITVVKCHFTGGSFKSGGALTMDGKSVVSVDQSTFTGISVKYYGGAFYLTNFGSLTLTNVEIRDCWNSENHLGGGTIYSQLGGRLIIKSSEINLSSVGVTQNMVYVSEIEVDFDNLTINASGNTYSTAQQSMVDKAGGIEFMNMDKIIFKNSIVEGVKRTQQGGGIGIKYTVFSLNPSFTHQLTNIHIKNNQAKKFGGGVHITNALNVAFSNVSVEGNRVLNGKGGGVYFQTQETNKAISVKFDKDCSVTGNSVNGSGGAISWNYYSPQNLPPIIQRNTATLYGGQFSSYPSKIRISNSSRALFLSGLKSGGVIPTIKAAIVDKFDQIDKSDSHSIVTLQANSNSTKFNTVLNGYTTVIAVNGEIKYEGVVIITEPGTTLSLTMSTNGIDPSLPDNKENGFGKTSSQTISTRSCIEGEAFLATGECLTCLPSIEYSLVTLNTTGTCKKCNTQQMVCLGGSRIGPRPGYWRISNTSDTFYACLRPQACLGMRPPNFSPIGDCQLGFEGKLCAQCQDGYSTTGQFNCSKCPKLVYNILRMLATLLAAIIMIVILVKSTIKGAHKPKKLESIYFKILMNHYQLIYLCSNFEFSWPENEQKFFFTQEVVANASTQFLSIECFLYDIKTNFSSVGIYYFVLLQYGLLPIIFILISIIFWLIKSRRCMWGHPKLFVSRVIVTVIIVMFLIHPSIVTTMFDSINCMSIQGKRYIRKRIETQCYTWTHWRWVIAVTIPSLLVWGLGTPLYAWLVLHKNRRRLDSIQIKQKYGFLYNRYKKTRFYWESVIMYRKVMIIFISVFLNQYSTITQALFLAMLLVCFLIIQIQLQPFSFKKLNQTETISILASLLTVYCGFFYIADNFDSGSQLSEASKTTLLIIILTANLAFFATWGLQFIDELIKSFKKQFPAIFIFICFLGRQYRLDKEIQKTHAIDQSQSLRGELEVIVSRIFKAYDSNDLVLNQNLIERLEVYLDVDQIKKGIRYDHPECFSTITPEEETKVEVKQQRIFTRKQTTSAYTFESISKRREKAVSNHDKMILGHQIDDETQVDTLYNTDSKFILSIPNDITKFEDDLVQKMETRLKFDHKARKASHYEKQVDPFVKKTPVCITQMKEFEPLPPIVPVRQNFYEERKQRNEDIRVSGQVERREEEGEGEGSDNSYMDESEEVKGDSVRKKRRRKTKRRKGRVKNVSRNAAKIYNSNL